MEFSFKDILQIVRKNILFILIVSIVAGAGAFACTKLFIKPTYTSTVKLYVNTTNSGKTSYEDLNSHNYAQKMVATYIEILDTNHFYSKVAMSLPDRYNEAFLKKSISFSEVTDTEVFSATATANDPIEAKTIADAVAKAAPATIKEQFEGNASLKIVDEAQLPKNPTSLRDYFDVKIKYDDELTVLCGLPLLAAIPEFAKTNESQVKKQPQKKEAK